MSTIVGNGYSYVTCDQPGCRNATPKHYGEHDGQQGVKEAAVRAGWRLGTDNRRATCPECLAKGA